MDLRPVWMLAALPALAIEFVKLPEGGLQPQVAVRNGAAHLLYFTGEAKGGDLQYVRWTREGFSQPLRVNSQPGSAIATGTIRGGQIAVGADGTIHVAWNGSDRARPQGPVNPDSGKPGNPMLYSRLVAGEAQFEPQRNLMRHTYGLDGGGTIAAGAKAAVFVAWHGKGSKAAPGEAGRQVWLAKSHDGGRTFAEEVPAWDQPTGACGCCGMTLFAESAGSLLGLYRSAKDNVHRDIYLISSKDGARFNGSLVQPWEINACPMSSMAFAEGGGATVAAWETAGQVYFGTVKGAAIAKPLAAPGEGKGRKHPRVARNGKGESLLVWTEGTGWQRGGSLAWQVFDSNGKAMGEQGSAPGIPAWSFGAAAAMPDGSFVIFG